MSAVLSNLALRASWLPRISPSGIVNTIGLTSRVSGSLAKDVFSYISGRNVGPLVSANPFLTLIFGLGAARFLPNLRHSATKAVTGLSGELKPIKPAIRSRVTPKKTPSSVPHFEPWAKPIKPAIRPPAIPKNTLSSVHHFERLVKQEMKKPHRFSPKELERAAKKKARERADFWQQMADNPSLGDYMSPEKRKESAKNARAWKAYAQGKHIPEGVPYDQESKWRAENVLDAVLYELNQRFAPQTVFNIQEWRG